MVPRHLPKQSKVASPRSRLHKLGHRNVTIGKQTRWLTSAGLCISTRKFGAFSSRQTSLVAKPRDALDTHRHPKGLKLKSKAQTTGQPPNTSRDRKPCKNGIFAFSYRREVLAKNANGSGMKNLTIASRCAWKRSCETALNQCARGLLDADRLCR